MSKRASGEGSVRQRPNGLWEARLSYVDPLTGRRRSASFYGATARPAPNWPPRVAVSGAQAPVIDSSMSLADWIERWVGTALEASDRKAATRQRYRDIARKHLCRPPLGGCTAVQVAQSPTWTRSSWPSGARA